MNITVGNTQGTTGITVSAAVRASFWSGSSGIAFLRERLADFK